MSKDIQKSSNRFFISRLGKTVVEAWSPARLKVLVPEMQVMVLAAISGERDAVGIWVPRKTRSAWISSETTRTWYLRHSSIIRMRSSLLQTMPRGLWGLQKRKSLAS